MDSFYLGYRWNPKTGRVGKRETYDLRSHFTLIGPTGCSKGVSVEIPNLLLGLHRSSVVSVDPSGQNAAVCAEARRQAGSIVLPLNPMGLHLALYPDLQSVGYNPMAALDPNDPSRFFLEAVALAEAIIPVEGESQKFFPESARGLVTWLIMYVRMRDGVDAHLGTVRDLLTEVDETDENGPIRGLRATAARAVATGHPRIASLAARFMKDSRSNADIVSTADTNTRWLLDDRIRADLAKNGIDFATLKDEPPKSVFLILPAGIELEFFGVWLRVVLTGALNALYRRGGEDGLQTLFMLSEFAQLGKLAPILAALGQGRKYGIRLAPIVLQNTGQLRQLYGSDGAGTFIANSGCVMGFTPGETDTAEWMSKMSDDHSVIGVNASDNPHGGTARLNFGEKQERVWSPGKIRSLPERHALIWKFGQSQPQPVYCPPYWDLSGCRLARPDPYHHASPAPGRKLTTRLAALIAVVAVIAGTWLLYS